MNFVEDVLEPVYKFFINLASKISGQEESVLSQKIGPGQFVLLFIIGVVVIMMIVIAVGDFLKWLDDRKKREEEKALRKRLAKQKDEEIVKMGEIKYEPLDSDKNSHMGIHLKDRFDDPVEQSLSSGYLLLDPDIEGEWLFFDRAQRLAPGNSGLLNAVGAWEQYRDGKTALEYGYFKVEVLPNLSGKYYISCTEGSYLDILPGERPLRRLLLVKLLDEEYRLEQKCEYFLLEEIEDVFSVGRILRLWRGNLTIPEDSTRIQTIVDQEVEIKHPNGSQMIN